MVSASSRVGGSGYSVTLDGQRYICDSCGRDFKRRNDMLRHVRIHTGEKPFACFFCTAAYTRKSHLKVHCKTNHHMEDREFEAMAFKTFTSVTTS